MIGKLLLGRYKIESRIGRGGMGEVYLAEDVKLQRKVAIKMMRDPQARNDRFLREMRILVRLSHPRIIAVHDADFHEDEPLIVMEYVQGKTLRDLLKTDRVPPLPQVMEISAGICEGLEYIHEQGVIHRDLKPSNIIISEHGQVKIMDFGISKGLGMQTLTQAKAVLGTPMYMSPEIAMGEAVDPRSDIYSFGMILYEMLVGKPAPSIRDRMRQQWAPSEDLLYEKRPELPEIIEKTVMRCLAENPDDRFLKASQLKREIQIGQIQAMQVSSVDAPTRISFSRHPVPKPVLTEESTDVDEEGPGHFFGKTEKEEDSGFSAGHNEPATQVPTIQKFRWARVILQKKRLPLFLGITGTVAIVVAAITFFSLERCTENHPCITPSVSGDPF